MPNCRPVHGGVRSRAARGFVHPVQVDVLTYRHYAGSVRTTVRLDDQLLADAKRHAAQTGRTLTSLIDEGLRDLLARRAAPLPAGRITLPTGGRGGLQPGVTLDSNAALLDVMDRGRDPA